jgi:hypothetical protein
MYSSSAPIKEIGRTPSMTFQPASFVEIETESFSETPARSNANCIPSALIVA